MAQTILIQPDTHPVSSDDFDVGTTPVAITLYSGESDGSFSRVKIKVEKRLPGENAAYQPFYDEFMHRTERAAVFLYQDKRDYLIKSPGTYRVVKDDTDKQVGVFSEDGV